MRIIKTYQIPGQADCRQQFKAIFICFLLIFAVFSSNKSFAQLLLSEDKNIHPENTASNSGNDPEITRYDEIMITLHVPRIGSIEIPALIYKETAFLPIKELFDFLKIRNTVSADTRIIEGFFIDPAVNYRIDKSSHLIFFREKKYDIKPSDIILAESGLYLKSELFGEIFGLDCQFSFRSLSVKLVTNVELPALREMKMEAMHRNLSQLKGERKADTIIERTFSILKVGMIDWSVISNKETKQPDNTRATLGIGGIFLGGETNAFLNYYNNRPFQLKDQFYSWRYVNNNLKAFKQITLGKILPNPSSTIINGINGIQVNNTPTTFRRSFGTYTLSNRTEPGWMVELYVNNVLLDYTKADASGFFTFEVPMVYGNSVVRLRFYGPWGEEQTREQNLSVPFNFLPDKKFEYDLSAGVLEDDQHSRFARSQFNYGVSKRFTVGAGMEYLSSVSGKVMPFMKASIRLGESLFVTAEHMQGVRSTGLISYRLPSNLRAEFSYLRYDKNQKAIRINFLEEKKLVLSKPFRGTKYSIFSRLTINQFTLSNMVKSSNYTSAELLVSAVAFGISSNLTSYAIITERGIPLAYSNLSMTYRLPHKINILPQVQFEYNRMKFSFLKMETEKAVFNKGFMNVSYQWDLKNNDYIVGVGLRLNLSFIQTTHTIRQNKQSAIISNMARGSLLIDTKTSFIGLNNQNNVGKGGLIVAAFLDLNCNGKREANEPAAPGLKLRINGGRIQRIDRDTTIRITGLDPYTNYFVELDKSSFENIAWQIKKSVVQININPNHFTYLEVPVSVVGEVSGTVYFHANNRKAGLGRMIVNIYNSDTVFVARTITEADGFFSYLGLPPGDYMIKIDQEQLNKLNMKSSLEFLQVTMVKSKTGGFANGLTFNLSSTDDMKE